MVENKKELVLHISIAILLVLPKRVDALDGQKFSHTYRLKVSVMESIWSSARPWALIWEVTYAYTSAFPKSPKNDILSNTEQQIFKIAYLSEFDERITWYSDSQSLM